MPFFSSKKILGIDIGISSIKIVELSKAKEKIKLENYGEIQSKFLHEEPFRTFGEGTLFTSIQDIARAIIAILTEAKIRTRLVYFSLPDFLSFLTVLQFPEMNKEELAQAVQFEAKQHVPLPVSDMVLDWILVNDKPFDKKEKKLKVLLVAVPRKIVNQYQEIAELAKLELQGLEAEVFALKRAFFTQEKKVIALIDIGVQSTTCSIVEGGILKTSHSFDVSGNDLTKGLMDSLDIKIDLAEKLKTKYGLLPQGQVIPEILKPILDAVIIETEKIFHHFFEKEGKNIEEIVLAGGTANLKGIQAYFKEKLGKEVRTGNPFSKIVYPSILKRDLEESGPSFAVAVGVGLGKFQEA